MADTISRGNRDLTKNSDSGGLVMITIPTPAADILPDSQPCLRAFVRHFSGTASFMNVNVAAVAASSWPLGSTIHEMKVSNLNQLHFIGTAGDKVQILWLG